MEVKGNIKQLELFSQVRGINFKGSPLKRPILFSRFLHYEKAIFIFIGALAIFIFGFSLGVEKGKKINKLFEINREKIVNENITIPPSEKINVQQPTPKKITSTLNQDEKEKKERKVKSGPTEIPKKYTIQVATFSNKNFAEKELTSLEKRGYTTFIIFKSGKNLVCVGNFLNKDNAKSSLVELKKRYQDCFIRNL